MIILLKLILSLQVHAQVDVSHPNLLIQNIVPSEYKVEVVSKINDSEFMFVPSQKSLAKKLYRKRSGTLLTDDKNAEYDDYSESNIVLQSFSTGGNYEFYAAKKQGEGWDMYRYTDGNHSSKNLSNCKSENHAFLTRTDIECIFASERICKKSKTDWPANKNISKQQFKDFLATESKYGFKKYQEFSAKQFTALRDRMSNTYDLDNFTVVNRVEEVASMDDGPLGDSKRGIVLNQMRELCEKAWPHLKERESSIPNTRRDAPKSIKRQGTR